MGKIANPLRQARAWLRTVHAPGACRPFRGSLLVLAANLSFAVPSAAMSSAPLCSQRVIVSPSVEDPAADLRQHDIKAHFLFRIGPQSWAYRLDWQPCPPNPDWNVVMQNWQAGQNYQVEADAPLARPLK